MYKRQGLATQAIGNVTQAIRNFGAGIVDAAGRFEQYQIQLNTLFKSADVGKKVFNDLLKTATETPVSYTHLDVYKRQHVITLEFSKRNIRIDLNDDEDLVISIVNPCEIYDVLSKIAKDFRGY